MSDKRKQLLLAALKHAGKPLSSDEALDEATGLALSSNWQTRQLDLDRRSVSALLRSMVRDGQVIVDGHGVDVRAGRSTPKYSPKEGYDVNAMVPAPPNEAGNRRGGPYEEFTRPQLLAVIDAQEAYLEVAGRYLADMAHVREKARRILQNAGVDLP